MRQWQLDKYRHMISDVSVSELHLFARSIGVGRHWYENKRGRKQPHYDISGDQVVKAIRHGAKEISRKEIVKILKRTYNG